MLASGLAFILPSALLVLAIAAAYAGLGDAPAARWLLTGMAPVAVVVIIRAIVGIAPGALRGKGDRAIALVALVAVLVGVQIGRAHV